MEGILERVIKSIGESTPMQLSLVIALATVLVTVAFFFGQQRSELNIYKSQGQQILSETKELNLKVTHLEMTIKSMEKAQENKITRNQFMILIELLRQANPDMKIPITVMEMLREE